MRPGLTALRWTAVLMLALVVAFEFARVLVDPASAEEATAIIFFAAMASLIIGLPNRRYRTLTGLMVLLGSIASVAFAGLWSPVAAVAASLSVVCGLGVSLVLGREDIHPLLLPACALSHRAISFVYIATLRATSTASRRYIKLQLILSGNWRFFLLGASRRYAKVQLALLIVRMRLRVIGDRIASRFPTLKPLLSAMGWVSNAVGRTLSFVAKLISVTLKSLAHATGMALSFAAKIILATLKVSAYTTRRVLVFARQAPVLSARALYRARVSILIGAVLFASVAFSSRAVTWGSEYVKNGSFDQGFDGWTVPRMRYPGEFISNEHWYLPEKSCLTLAASSQRGLSYDRLAVFQPLDIELSWGVWTVSGYMGNTDVGLNPGSAECDALATSVAIVLRDNVGKTRYLKYAVFVQGELHSTPSEGVVEVGTGEARQFDFTRDLIRSIQEVWGIPYAIGWRVIGVELLVEFWGNWGEALHLEAVFDEISLRRESDLRWLAELAGFALLWLPIACLPTLIGTYPRVPREKPSRIARSESVFEKETDGISRCEFSEKRD